MVFLNMNTTPVSESGPPRSILLCGCTFGLHFALPKLHSCYRDLLLEIRTIVHICKVHWHNQTSVEYRAYFVKCGSRLLYWLLNRNVKLAPNEIITEVLSSHYKLYHRRARHGTCWCNWHWLVNYWCNLHWLYTRIPSG